MRFSHLLPDSIEFLWLDARRRHALSAVVERAWLFLRLYRARADATHAEGSATVLHRRVSS